MRTILSHFFLFVTFLLSGQTVDETFLIDFGPNNEVDGTETTSPDTNGNHWCNVTNPVATSIKVKLVTVAGVESDYRLSIASPLSKNGINHGGLLAPDGEFLDEFAVASATQDYFFTASSGSLELSGLETNKAYKFSLFASRDHPETRLTRYEITGANGSILEIQSSGADLGESGSDANESQVVESDYIFPDFTGTIRIAMSVEQGSFAYLNLMQIEEFSEVELVKVEELAIIEENITVNGGESQQEVLITPAEATVQGVSWMVDDQDLASISEEGILIARKNGSVNVQASTQESGSDVSASALITLSNQDVFSYLVDLGPDDGVTGNATSFSEWNNISMESESEDKVDLFSIEGETHIQARISQSFLSNGLEAVGLDLVDDYLGELGVLEAIQDYFSTQNSGTIIFSGLSDENGYRFDLFGSRESTDPRETRYTLEGLNNDTGVLSTSNNSSAFFTSDIIFPDENGEIKLKVSVAKGSFAYLNAMRIIEYHNVDICPSRDSKGIAFMGSSVARGQGAPGDMGYAFQYTELLKERAGDWNITNISVGGDNTVKLLNRWEQDLVPLCGSYVIYGLSLGNEGIANTGQVAFDRYEENMLQLIQQARDVGLQPVVMNNYTREDFGPSEYGFIKEMNLRMHQWDVPSVNLLGAIDNGTGNWASGYQQDFGHPNLAGHKEFFYAMVPSMFDALDNGKALPEKKAISLYEVGPGTNEYLEWQPENVLHSFTLDFNLLPNGPAEILSFSNNENNHQLLFNSSGALIYRTDGSDSISLTLPDVMDTLAITLTHYYAMGKTFLYLNGEKAPDNVEENLEVSSFIFGRETDLNSFMIGDLLLYRSGMNPEEAQALYDEKLLQSSLEIYAPLDAESDHLIQNFATSTNELILGFFSGLDDDPSDEGNLTLFPNPSSNRITLDTHLDYFSIYNQIGDKVMEGESAIIDISTLTAGTYILKARLENKYSYVKFLKI